jgi:hypothetical protein
MVDIEEQFARGFNGALVITQGKDILNDALQKWDNIGNEMYAIVERNILGEINNEQALQLLDLAYGKAGEIKPPSPKLTTPSEVPSDELLRKTMLKMADELREGRKALAAKYEHCKAAIKSTHGREALPGAIGQTQAPDIAQSKPAPKSRAYTMASRLFLYYPDFESDYETLLKDYMQENVNGLQWLKSKQSLAEYFGNLPKKGENHKWADIEKLFNEKNLRQSFSRNGNSYKGQSADYAAWLNIKNIAPTSL